MGDGGSNGDGGANSVKALESQLLQGRDWGFWRGGGSSGLENKREEASPSGAGTGRAGIQRTYSYPDPDFLSF